MYHAGFIEGVAGEFSGNCFVDIDELNNVVAVRPMTLAPATELVGVAAQPRKKASSKDDTNKQEGQLDV